MKRVDWVSAWRSARTGAYVLAVATACSAAFPQQTLAAQVETYVIFEVAASADQTAVAEKLRSTSLNNCLQLVVGQHARTSSFTLPAMKAGRIRNISSRHSSNSRASRALPAQPSWR